MKNLMALLCFIVCTVTVSQAQFKPDDYFLYEGEEERVPFYEDGIKDVLKVLDGSPSFERVLRKGKYKKMLKTIGGTYPEAYKYSDPGEFWEHIRDHSRMYLQYFDDYNSRLAQTIRGELEMFLDGIPREGLPLTGLSIPMDEPFLLLSKNEDLNACCYPNGMIVMDPTFCAILTKEELLGVVAHEVAHYYLKHHESGPFAAERRRRANNALSIVSGVMVAAGGAATAASSVGSGVSLPDDYYQNTVQTILMIDSDLQERTILYKFRYTRTQELEADIVAARFLQSQGYSTINLISAFQKIKVEMFRRGESISGSGLYDTHPSLNFRILALRALDAASHFSLPPKVDIDLTADIVSYFTDRGSSVK